VLKLCLPQQGELVRMHKCAIPTAVTLSRKCVALYINPGQTTMPMAGIAGST